MKSIFAAVMVVSCAITSLSQEDSIAYRKHEFGWSAQYRFGRITPGFQYLYSVKPSQQIGVNLNLFYGRSNENNQFFSPELSLAYRWKFHLFRGLSAYVAPTLSYGLLTSTLLQPTHEWGLGVNTGLEYDFSENNVPLVIGIGTKTVATYSRGRLGYLASPTLSLRIRF